MIAIFVNGESISDHSIEVFSMGIRNGSTHNCASKSKVKSCSPIAATSESRTASGSVRGFGSRILHLRSGRWLRSDAQFGDVLAVPHRTLGPVSRKERVLPWGLDQGHECEELIPKPLVRRQRSARCNEIVKPGLRGPRVQKHSGQRIEQTLNDDIVLRSVSEEYRSVDHRIVEVAAPCIILENGVPGNIENLQTRAEYWTKRRIRP